MRSLSAKLTTRESLGRLLVGAVLLGAVLLGNFASGAWLYLVIAGFGAVAVLARPELGLSALIICALVVPLEFGTGTGVRLNTATMLVPALLVVWFLRMLLQRKMQVTRSRLNAPLFLFLLAGLLSLLVGTALWDPQVPRSGDFLTVQFAQWAIFAFSASALWLAGNLVRDQATLQRLTWLFLSVGGSLAVLLVVSQTPVLRIDIGTAALYRAPFWLLLVAIAGGQLAFNSELKTGQGILVVVSLGAAFLYALVVQRETASNWVGVAAVLGVLGWLRFPRLRWPVVALLIVLSISGALTSAVYEFAGGEAEWIESGGSRLVLMGRVLEVTMRNPITGLGPAAYRLYAQVEPLQYFRALWYNPNVSSHNNYVDLFSHVGLLGLGLFLWFAVEVFRLGFRLRAEFKHGLASGFVNGMIAAWAGSLVLMLFADWILPFVYNIGFPGFQASVLVWLFLGGLLAIEQIADHESTPLSPEAPERDGPVNLD
jgi:hypothetical protein